jgi:homoserine kinase type II
MGIKELGPLLKSIKFKSKKFNNLQNFLANTLKDIKKKLAFKTSSRSNSW